MAERRMFAKTIIDSDAFLDMPLSSQCLYFHLSMRADDEGFVNNPKKILRMIGCSEDDLKILLAKSFILAFEDGVIVIKHWKLNNYIQSDRFKPTVYTENKELLVVKDNKSYSFKNECIQDGYTLDTQVRLGKDSIDNTLSSKDEVSKAETVDKNYEDFEKIYSIYPKKGTKQSAYKSYLGWIKGKKVLGKTVKLTPKQIWYGVDNYVTECKNKGTEDQYYKNFSTLMNQILDYTGDDE